MSKFNPTHKTPDGTLLHSDTVGGVVKYWTEHNWNIMGDTYKGPVEDLSGFGYRDHHPPGNEFDLHGGAAGFAPGLGYVAINTTIGGTPAGTTINASIQQGQAQLNQTLYGQNALASLAKTQGSSIVQHAFMSAVAMTHKGLTVLVVSEVLPHADDVDDVVEDYLSLLTQKTRTRIRDFVHEACDTDYSKYDGKVHIYLVAYPGYGYPAQTSAMQNGGSIYRVALGGNIT